MSPDLAGVFFGADVTACRATGADRVVLGEEPDPLIVKEVFVQQSTNRAEVNHIASQWVIQWMIREDRDFAVVPSTHHLQFRCTCDFAGKPHAPGAHDAAIRVEYNQVGNLFARLNITLFNESVLGSAVRIAVILKTTLTRLITHWTIQRVVDQQQFHDVFAMFQNLDAVGHENRSIANRCLTAGREPGQHLDLAGSVLAANLDLAHAAVGDNR